ncbi:DNA-directed RNA polymerases I and III subunit RPAC1 [Araneus ventricosus]|uniref:DNA-directed RNA polymerases I and III subunit RPAC1 n=1 Tax=Araneus ventricosus TaxID=182803 RepID=A0A4Y2US93_ARAVE|nr:DNA-directed RNA polymerases I and III subunit RPAC1 [Araneus ventricosus]
MHVQDSNKNRTAHPKQYLVMTHEIAPRKIGEKQDGSEEANYGAKAKTVEDLMKEFKIKIMKIDEENMDMEFDMIGIGPPIANAIRRILLAEIPTMAIDKIHLYNNTTVIPDEVLTHRIGLVPIKVDPRLFVSKANG